MQKRQHLTQAHANQRVSRFELKISKLRGDPQPEEYLDWVLAVEEVFEFNGVPNEQRVSLVIHTFRRRVAAWWQQLKQNWVRQGKSKINSWEKLLKKMRVAFLSYKYTMGRQSQNWRQSSMTVTKNIEKSYKKEVFRETWIEAESP
jgi:CRISPR/Cas system CSM-associated protein Csm2 small subunit